MPQPIELTVGDITLRAELNDSPTAQELIAALPISGSASRWGDEYYFSTPVSVGEGPDATADWNVGDLAFWPPGNAFCILFGPTPASSGDAPRTASPANPIGQILDDIEPLKSLGGSVVIGVAAM